MRLLLDELYSPRIAEQLRARGHDVEAVKERPDLEGASDADLLSRMRTEGRAILTENWGDFQRLLADAASAGESHGGVVFTSHRQLARSTATIGLYVRVLDEFLRRHAEDDALANSYRWLP